MLYLFPVSRNLNNSWYMYMCAFFLLQNQIPENGKRNTFRYYISKIQRKIIYIYFLFLIFLFFM